MLDKDKARELIKELDVEIAKSWFVFAQIAIILAGFLFTASGVTINVASTNVSSNLLTFSWAMNLFYVFFFFGGIFTILSIIFWTTGKKKLENSKKVIEESLK